MADDGNTGAIQQPDSAPLNPLTAYPNARDRRQVQRAVAQDRRGKALALRLNGATYQQIADALGYKSRDGAFKAVDSALRDSPHERVEQLRTIELDRLDKMQRTLAKRVQDGDLGAMDRWLKIMEHRAKLLGIYAPERQQVQVSGGMVVVRSDVDPDEVRGGKPEPRISFAGN